MERGRARITAGYATIDAESGPTPVDFNLVPGSGVADNTPVLFQRSSSDPRWASKVVPAITFQNLVNAAGPTVKYTPEASALIAHAAFQFVAEAQLAPTTDQAGAHLAFAEQRMNDIAKAGVGRKRPMGVKAVTGLLA